MAAAFRAAGARADPRHRAEPHGDRRRGQPLLARRAGMGAGEPLRALVRHRLGGGASRPRRQGAGAGARRAVRHGAGRRARWSCASMPADGSFAVWAHGTHKLPVCAAALRAHPARRRPRRARRRRRRRSAGAAPADPRWAALRGGASPTAPRRSTPALAAFRGAPGSRGSWAALDALIADAALAGGEVQPRPATRSTTAASSRSAISRGCGSRTRRSSRPRSAWCSRWSTRAWSTGCGSTISTGCATRRPTCRRLRQRRRGRSGCSSRRSLRTTRRCRPTGASTARPATSSPTCSPGSWSTRAARRR